MKVRQRAPKTTQLQRELLLNLVENNPKLNSPVYTEDFSRQDFRKIWEEATEILNAEGPDCEKRWDQWLKSWQDWRCKVKTKSIALKRFESTNRGQTPFELRLTPLEERMLPFINPASDVSSLVFPSSSKMEKESPAELFPEQDTASAAGESESNEEVVSAQSGGCGSAFIEEVITVPTAGCKRKHEQEDDRLEKLMKLQEKGQAQLRDALSSVVEPLRDIALSLRQLVDGVNGIMDAVMDIGL